MASARNDAGFTLVETLVAMFLLLVLLIALAPMFVYATRGSASGADLSWLGAAAVDRMETLRQRKYYDLTAGGSTTSSVTGYFDASNPDLIVRWQITDVGTPRARKIIVVRAVSTRETVGRPKEAVLTTIRAR